LGTSSVPDEVAREAVKDDDGATLLELAYARPAMDRLVRVRKCIVLEKSKWYMQKVSGMIALISSLRSST
jgi:hypothetical protein